MLRPFFAETPTGRRLYLHHRSQHPLSPNGLVLYVHPFAEEMNKTRRMAALQARALAAAGFEVLQLDLHGCGDSDGDFEHSSWAAWLQDVAHSAAWLKAQHPNRPLWLWGLRAGALLAGEAARLHAAAIGPCHLLMWQAVAQGQTHLRQFLRLLTVGALHEEERSTQAELMSHLQGGQSIDVAGYTLPPALALGLQAATLKPTPAQGTQRLVWLEVSALEEPALLPASPALLEGWQAQGWQVQARAVQGPAFWQTAEIEDAPALLQATLDALAA